MPQKLYGGFEYGVFTFSWGVGFWSHGPSKKLGHGTVKFFSNEQYILNDADLIRRFMSMSIPLPKDAK